MKYPVLLMALTALSGSLVASEAVNVYGRVRGARASNPVTVAQPQVEHINYRPYSQVPADIKQILQFQQAREPITHIPAQPPPQLAKAPSQNRPQYNPQVQYGASQPSHQQYQAQPQAAYNPGVNPQAQFNPHPYQQGQPQNSVVRNHQQQQQQQQPPGGLFYPDQRRLY
ncbi:gamma-gliadin-like [Neodiprion fabricii]|uniref:gamma-gliadin-like n=1 Tax=Neodiprion fabricii TaxID=2872261 RepID=UPI001ED96D90|nr:gamma-gliadin-like [Neodiprion fabricii]